MLNILVVEDELYARESLVKQIREYDSEREIGILQAANGEDGWRLYQEARPALVMTDVRMPKMDGLQLLEKIGESGDKTQVVIISAYSDFEYARKALTNGAVDYLLKPVEDQALQRCLDKVILRDRHERKAALLTGRDMLTQFLEKSIQQEGTLSFVEKSMFRKMFPAYRLTAFSFLEAKPEEALFLSMVEEVCKDAFWTKVRFLKLEAIWLLAVCEEEGNDFLQRKIKKRLEGCGYPASLGVSGVHRMPEEVREAYLEAAEALKYKIYAPGIYYAEQLQKEEPAAYYLSGEQEETIRDGLRGRSGRQIEEALRGVFDRLREGVVRVECLEVIYQRITALYLQSLGSEGREETSWSELQKGILRFESLDKMEQFLVNIGKNICRMSARDTAQERRDVTEMMADYARKHYEQEVSVKILAEKVLFMNQDYLSHLFAEKQGISFSAFVRRLRIAKARALLEQGTYSVTEVAAMTGYNDVSQFIRVFKQETGMTPKKYRGHQDGRTKE